MDALTTTGLTKHYGHREPPIHPPGHKPAGVVRALANLSIAVHEGEIFGFLGPNGAGKSTTIRLLLGYLHPTAGSGSVFGLDIVRDSVEIRRRVGYLPGGIALYDSLTGERLLDYLGDLTGRPSVRRAELLDRLELSARTLRRQVRDYSRGMRQKIGIVQALQHDPELAILDEPTEGLDPLMQRAFYGILDDLRAAGRTIFFSSHILSEVERVCDRVAIVRRGQLVALEDVARLLERRKRNVELRVSGDPPRLDDVPGVSGVTVLADGRIACQLDGDVGPFLAAIAGHRVTDLTIEPAHLEEAFLELYEDAEPDGGVDDGDAGQTHAPSPPEASPAEPPEAPPAEPTAPLTTTAAP
ncbi:MAG TPA: ABC transporter ATP-binding protein [Verrucomicrobiae bacterium]|nr:ABC transporter ATP-binding protein [Verrucomicrobiae bacterium]